MNEDKVRWFVRLAGPLICFASSCFGGPPLVTDDPGILDPGTWEVITAVTGENRSGGDVYHLPSLDVSVGVGGNSQLSIFVPHLVVRPEDDEKREGPGFIAMTYKWQFLSRFGWELAVAPSYQIPVSHRVIRSGGPEDIRVLALPLLVSLSEGNWSWFGQLALNTGSDGLQWWDYGIAVSYPLRESLQWMSEVYGSASSSFGDSTLNYQLGLDYGISREFHLLASAGTRIKSISEPGFRLNYNFYLGLKWIH